MLSAADWETCQRIRDAVWRHPICQDLFREGQAEGSAWWLDPDTDLLCKCRPDWSRPGLLADLKTATDASPVGFARAIERYRYHVQAAYALDGWPQAGGGAADRFLFIVVEKTRPMPWRFTSCLPRSWMQPAPCTGVIWRPLPTVRPGSTGRATPPIL